MKRIFTILSLLIINLSTFAQSSLIVSGCEDFSLQVVALGNKQPSQQIQFTLLGKRAVIVTTTRNINQAGNTAKISLKGINGTLDPSISVWEGNGKSSSKLILNPGQYQLEALATNSEETNAYAYLEGTSTLPDQLAVNSTILTDGTRSLSINASQLGVNYQLKRKSTANGIYENVGSPIAGNGTAVTFSFTYSNSTDLGSYQIEASNGCGTVVLQNYLHIQPNFIPAYSVDDCDPFSMTFGNRWTTPAGTGSGSYSTSAIVSLPAARVFTGTLNAQSVSGFAYRVVILNLDTGVEENYFNSFPPSVTEQAGNYRITFTTAQSYNQSQTFNHNFTLTSNAVSPLLGPVSITSGAVMLNQPAASSTYTASAAGASSYEWSISGSGNTISGTGSTATVNWAPNFSGVCLISVKAKTSCYSSTERLVVYVKPAPICESPLNIKNPNLSLVPFEYKLFLSDLTQTIQWQVNAVPALNSETETQHTVLLEVRPALVDVSGRLIPDLASAGMSVLQLQYPPATQPLQVGLYQQPLSQFITQSPLTTSVYFYRAGLKYLKPAADRIPVEWTDWQVFTIEPDVAIPATYLTDNTQHTNDINWVYEVSYLDNQKTSQSIVIWMDWVSLARLR